MKKTLLFLVFTGAAIQLFFSCSGSEPKISYGFMELVFYQEKDRPEEHFSFFIIPEDDDGIENIAELYLYHDKEQLRWTILPEDWVILEQDGKTWIGSRAIAAGDAGTLPRGLYRAVLVNKGGEKSERSFTFDAPEENRFPFPSLTIENGEYRVSSSYPVNRFICYDEQGNVLSTLTVPALLGRVAEMDIPSNAKTVSLWAEDTDFFTSALTDVVQIR
jgi:hypothetical protein